MFVAKKKRRENIIEFILYMFQIEDTIRAFNLDIQQLDRHVIQQYNATDSQMIQIREWYSGLIAQMKTEKIYENGHLQSLRNLIKEVNELHLWLLKQPDQTEYHLRYNVAKPMLLEFQYKTKSKFTTEIEIAFNTLYSYILLKMKDKDISTETYDAVNKISQLLNRLAISYKNYEDGNLDVS